MVFTILLQKPKKLVDSGLSQNLRGKNTGEPLFKMSEKDQSEKTLSVKDLRVLCNEFQLLILKFFLKKPDYNNFHKNSN